MKTIDNSEDQNLKHFFNEMKAKDSIIAVPQFPKLRRPKSRILIPLGIAASLVLLAWFYSGNEQIPTLEKDVFIITLEEGENNELQFKIEYTSELESWESPTTSLLTEF
jgi:hypothetical protein